MEPYTGIAVFELSHWDAQTGKKTTYFREDFYIVYASSEEEAKKRVEAMALDQVFTRDEEPTSDMAVALRHIIDVAPALDGYVDRDCNLYSRHFASLEDYARFEMMLGGTDPFDEH